MFLLIGAKRTNPALVNGPAHSVEGLTFPCANDCEEHGAGVLLRCLESFRQGNNVDIRPCAVHANHLKDRLQDIDGDSGERSHPPGS